MKLLKTSFLILGLAWSQPGMTAPAAAPAGVSDESVKVPVELEWEEIPQAKLYELEFQNFEGKTLSVFKSASHIFRFKFKVGKYRVRSRVADARKVFGEWSELTEFTVQPKPVQLPEKPVSTNGVIDRKTLTSAVVWKWGAALGASQYRVRVVNATGDVVFEELVREASFKAALPAGTYTTTVTSIGAGGIESEPVALPGNVVIETVQLAQPVIAFDEVPDPVNTKLKVQRLPTTQGVPTLRWKNPSVAADTVGTLEYRYFFGEEWIPVDKFVSKKGQDVVLEKSLKPGRYRINAWSESQGLKKSEVTSYEFVVKPTKY